MPNSFLAMKHVSKRFTGVQALDDIDFDLQQAEIHCLCGENGSGKSTLIKIISGILQPDSGSEIEIEQTKVHHLSSIDAIRHGIEVIYQDLSLFPTLTAAENIALKQIIASRGAIVRPSEVRAIAERATQRIGIRVSLEETVEQLSIADQQLVAICRALTSDVRLLIMDEPTTALTRKEVDSLFRVITDLKASGVGTLFISHKLDEVFEIAERVTVIRDGKKVGTYQAEELNDANLTRLMTGVDIRSGVPDSPPPQRATFFRLDRLSKKNNFQDVSFELRRGEVLGITGLLGSGRTELALAIFGLNRPDSGRIYLDDKELVIRSVVDAQRHGIAYVPENRLVQGLVMRQAISRNIVITTVRRMLNRAGFLDRPRIRDEVDRRLRELSIKVHSSDAPVETLSGGNQQRVVLAKWMATNPSLLILDGPTVGIDIAAKSSIHEIIRNLARSGVGIILISDEVNEVCATCGRVLVMRAGRIIAAFEGSEVTPFSVSGAIAERR